MKLYNSKYPTKLPGIEKVCSQCFNWRLQQVRLEKGAGGRGGEDFKANWWKYTLWSETLMSKMIQTDNRNVCICSEILWKDVNKRA